MVQIRSPRSLFSIRINSRAVLRKKVRLDIKRGLWLANCYGRADFTGAAASKKEFGQWRVFILAMAKKITATSRTALKEFEAREKITLTAEQKKAVKMLA